MIYARSWKTFSVVKDVSEKVVFFACSNTDETFRLLSSRLLSSFITTIFPRKALNVQWIKKSLKIYKHLFLQTFILRNFFFVIFDLFRW